MPTPKADQCAVDGLLLEWRYFVHGQVIISMTLWLSAMVKRRKLTFRLWSEEHKWTSFLIPFCVADWHHFVWSGPDLSETLYLSFSPPLPLLVVAGLWVRLL